MGAAHVEKCATVVTSTAESCTDARRSVPPPKPAAKAAPRAGAPADSAKSPPTPARAAPRRATESAGAGVYKGELNDEGTKRQGKGKFTYPNGDWYDGEWVEHKATGQGTFWTRGSTYVGAWDLDLKHGHGEERFDDGTVYVGQYSQGYRHGSGKLTWVDGSCYDGQFMNNNQEGIGTYTWKSKHKYTGQWVDNYMHGAGRYEWPDGSSYDGQYNMSLKDGQGAFLSKNGQQIQCRWQNGRPQGLVMFRSPQYESKPLHWQDGVMTAWGARSEEPTPRGDARGDSVAAKGQAAGDAGDQGSARRASGARGGGGDLRTSQRGMKTTGNVSPKGRSGGSGSIGT